MGRTTEANNDVYVCGYSSDTEMTLDRTEIE